MGKQPVRGVTRVVIYGDRQLWRYAAYSISTATSTKVWDVSPYTTPDYYRGCQMRVVRHIDPGFHERFLPWTESRWHTLEPWKQVGEGWVFAIGVIDYRWP